MNKHLDYAYPIVLKAVSFRIFTGQGSGGYVFHLVADKRPPAYFASCEAAGMLGSISA